MLQFKNEYEWVQQHAGMLKGEYNELFGAKASEGEKG